jgi:hypothetical protein
MIGFLIFFLINRTSSCNFATELIEDTIVAELLAMNSAGTGDGNSSSAGMSDEWAD